VLHYHLWDKYFERSSQPFKANITRLPQINSKAVHRLRVIKCYKLISALCINATSYVLCNAEIYQACKYHSSSQKKSVSRPDVISPVTL